MRRKEVKTLRGEEKVEIHKKESEWINESENQRMGKVIAITNHPNTFDY